MKTYLLAPSKLMALKRQSKILYFTEAAHRITRYYGRLAVNGLRGACCRICTFGV